MLAKSIWKFLGLSVILVKSIWYNLNMNLILSWRRSLSYKNQSIDLKSKLMDWFLYDSKEVLS